MKHLYIYIICVLAVITSCKEQYAPEISGINKNILVVDGFINIGADSTIVKLSRTVVLNNKNTANPEIGATVSVETETNQAIFLTEVRKGVYAIESLNLGQANKYRLRIKTNGGSEYLSDFVEAKIAPPIESVSYEVKGNGVEIFVNTKDPTNKSKYYRWEYEESWIFFSKYNSQYIWRGGATLSVREPHEAIYQCWGNSPSSIVLTGSTAKLEQDVVSRQPVIFIPSTSEKLSEKYSILVKQYSLTKEAYDFWENLKKNTENLGSIFDVLPSELTGNVHGLTNKNELVIGYVSAGSIQKQRIFISKDKFPTWRPKYPYNCIEPDTLQEYKIATYYVGNILVPIVPIYFDNGVLRGWQSAQRECVDCTIRGTNRRPIFWQ